MAESARKTERELIALGKKFRQALKDGDVATATGLTADPCIVTGAQGVGRIDRRTFEAMMKAAPYKIDAFELKGVDVLMLGEDVAVLAYRVHEELTVEGKSVSLDAADSSAWVRREGRWVCALHTEAIAGDPFGRDRTAPPAS